MSAHIQFLHIVGQLTIGRSDDFRLGDAGGNYKLHTIPHPNTVQVRSIMIHPHVTLAAAAANYPFVWHVNYVRARHAMMSMDYLMAMATFFLAILLNLMHQGSFIMETWTSKAAAVIFGST